jgi:hypothetical protein
MKIEMVDEEVKPKVPRSEIERQEQGHTPTPWEVQAGDDYFITAVGYPKDVPSVVDNNLDDDVLVALVGNQTSDCGEANARFVVRAVNSHEALVEALQLALRESGCDGDLCNYRWHEKARSALALAEDSK